MNYNDNIRKNLIYLRKNKKLTQMELAEQIGYSDKTVSKWETGESLPNIDTLCALADFYGVTLDSLVKGGVEEVNKDKTIVKKSRYNKFAITMLAMSVSWILCIMLYVYISIVDGTSHWILFIWPVPVSFIVALVFNSIWGNRRHNYAIITVLLWTLLASVHLTLLCYANHNLYILYVLGIPLQIAIILWSGIKRIDKTAKQPKEERE